MSDFKVKRSLAEKVNEQVRSGKCLVCDKDAERRGLCMNHYQTFLRTMRDRGGVDEQAAFEASCIREGLVLPSGEMRKIKFDNPFASV